MSDEIEAADYVAQMAGKKPRAHPEEEFQAFVIDLARRNGWRVFYTPDWVHRLIRADMQRRRRDRDWPDRGFPDLVLVRPPELLVVENKSKDGTLTPGQKEWIADLKECGIEVRVWKPKDEAEIVCVLGRTAEAEAA